MDIETIFKLRSWIFEIWRNFDLVQCNMMNVREIGKTKIDKMYYLSRDEQSRYKQTIHF